MVAFQWFRAIRYFYLFCFNPIDKFPFHFPTLKELRALFLNMNNMTSFPEEVCRLSDLAILDVSNNRIRELPDLLRCSVADLENLEELDLSNNKLRHLPESIGKLARLQVLHVEGNFISELPPSMGMLQELTKLYVNKTIKLPSEVYQLPELEVL